MLVWFCDIPNRNKGRSPLTRTRSALPAMSEGAHGQRQGGGGRSAKWSTLRNAFLSAVESSKAGDGGRREACSSGSTGTGTSTTDPPRFEGFTLFPRCAGARRDSMIQQDVRWLPMCSSGGRGGGSKERATTSYTHTNSVEGEREGDEILQEAGSRQPDNYIRRRSSTRASCRSHR